MKLPGPPEGLFERIEAARRAGEHAILPIVPAGATTGGASTARWPVLIVAALFPVVLVVGWVVFATGSVEAHHPTMELVPGAPRAGSVLSVSFVGGSFLGGGERLTLRAQLFDRRGDGDVATAPLHRSSSRRGYRGELIVPPDAVYAVLAIEDSVGERVQTGAGHPWEVVVLDDVGRPRFAGLRQQVSRHFASRLDLALKAADAMVEHYPGSAESWRTLYAVERILAGPGQDDELAQRHHRHFTRLEQQFEVSPPTSADLAAMTLYARGVGDDAARERWTERLLRDAPHERLAVQIRVQPLEGTESEDPADSLREHERLWTELGPARDLIASGFALATRLGDGSAALRWAERSVAADPSTRASMASRLAQMPGVQEVGMAMIRQELRDTQTPGGREDRVPGVDVQTARLELERARARLLAVLGHSLIDTGQPRAGVDTLQLATELTWDPEMFRGAAEALLSVGDTSEAIPLLARLAVDPMTGPEERAELEDLAEGQRLPRGWDAEVDQARSRLHRQILSSAERRRLPAAIRVKDRDGRTHDLRDRLHGEVTVVSLWYCFCAQFEALVQRHRALAARLSAAGVPVHTIVVVDSGADSPEGIEGPDPGPILLDGEGAALRAFGYARTPAYFIVDAEARVRFAYPTADELLRQVEVLRQSEGPVAAGG